MKKSTTLIFIMAFALLILSGCNGKKNEPSTPENEVKDICNNTYKCVQIGSQFWMAENMRCEKYDTQSERAGAVLSTSSIATYASYYIDGHNAITPESGSLTSDQRSKLGYLYNWAAAVGLESESDAKNQASSFSGNRQGICPNGWHVPSDAEWNTLVSYVGSKAGTKLKTTSGWYGDGNGTDAYSFAALPAGASEGSVVNYLGSYANFWTSTPLVDTDAYGRFLYYEDADIQEFYNDKSYAQSVRCVKN